MRGAGRKWRRGAVLRLVLASVAVPVARRRLPRHPRLHVDTGNCVVGRVNGSPCPVQLDSGAHLTVVFWSLARSLGLIRGTERWVTQRVELWTGPVTLRVVQLDSVTVELGGGVQVVTPVTVFPAWLEALYDATSLVLDAHQLRRGAMLQVFRPGGSDLYVCRPQRLQRPVKKTYRSVQPDVLRVRPAEGGEAMTVLLDTGSMGIHVSAGRRELLVEARQGRPLPRRVLLDMGGGCCLHTHPLGVVTSNDHDFILGVSALCSNGAILDHGRHTLTLRVGSGWRRVNMRLPPPGKHDKSPYTRQRRP